MNRQPENQSKKYSVLFADIDSGRMKIPQFQRDFVWDKGQTAKLIDSVIKGFPVGTLIIWKTRERLRHLRQIGNIKLPEPPSGDSIQYVLDGQQRITSLYAVRKGLRITRDGRVIDYKDICIDLSVDADSQEECVFEEVPESTKAISVFKLLTQDITEFDEFEKEERKKIHLYRERLTGYDFSVIEIPEYNINEACEIFTRINTGGKVLSLFEIMVAKTYDLDSDFDLAEKYEELLYSENSQEKSLEDAGFETIPAMTVLHCVSTHILASIKSSSILSLDRKAVIAAWPNVKSTMFTAIDHLQSNLGVAVSRLLPYSALLVPFSYFFDRNELKPADEKQSILLAEFFYWASLGSRYTSAVATKMTADLHKMDDILKHKRPSYQDEDTSFSPEYLAERSFSINDAFSKAIVCLLASKNPLSLSNNGKIKLNNSWLHKSSSKNLHHIFPKAYIRSRTGEELNPNCIGNIMISDDFMNKRVFKARSPKDYFADIIENNKNYIQALATHFIDEQSLKYISKNDYKSFLNHRGTLISAELNRITS